MRLSYGRTVVTLILVAFIAASGALSQQVADTAQLAADSVVTPSGGPDFGTLTSGLVFAAATLGVFATAGIKAVTGKIDRRIATAIKPAQPIILLGLTYALSRLGVSLNLSDLPPADLVVQAPVATVALVAAREGLKALVTALKPRRQPGPLYGTRGGEL